MIKMTDLNLVLRRWPQAGQRHGGRAAGHRDVPDIPDPDPMPPSLPELDEVAEDGGVAVIGGIPGHAGSSRAHLSYEHSGGRLRGL